MGGGWRGSMAKHSKYDTKHQSGIDLRTVVKRGKAKFDENRSHKKCSTGRKGKHAISTRGWLGSMAKHSKYDVKHRYQADTDLRTAVKREEGVSDKNKTRKKGRSGQRDRAKSSSGWGGYSKH